MLKMVSLENLNKIVKKVYGDNYKVRISTVEDIEERNKSKILYIADKQIKDAAIVLGELLYSSVIDIKMYIYLCNINLINKEGYIKLDSLKQELTEKIEYITIK